MHFPAAEVSDLDEVTRRGRAIYDAQLKPLLEPSHNGQTVAIHLDTGDHRVERSIGDALRAIRKVHPTGQLFVHTIGRATDFGLAHRIDGFRFDSRSQE